MRIDKIHQIVNILPDPYLLISLHRQLLLDLVDIPRLSLIK